MEASDHSANIMSTDLNASVPVPLSAYVKQTLELYFAQLSDHDATNLHALVMCEVERPLLEAALAHSGHNQSKAAKVLGLSRSTLRKKLEHYGIS